MMRVLSATLLAGAAAFMPTGVVPRSRWALAATYQVTLNMPDGQVASFPCPDDELILDAAEEAGFELPSSCRSGSCSSCQMRLLSGAVEQDEQSVLEDEHLAAGYVCSCSAYAESDVVLVTHQEDNFEAGVLEFSDAPAAVPAAAAPAPAPAPAPAAPPAAAPAAAAPPSMAKPEGGFPWDSWDGDDLSWPLTMQGLSEGQVPDGWVAYPGKAGKIEGTHGKNLDCKMSGWGST